MTDEPAEPMSEAAPSQPQNPWAGATVGDVLALDLDAPILPEAASDWHSLSDGYYSAAKQEGTAPNAGKVFRMLGGLLSMMPAASSPTEPFRPMMVWGDGRRSAAVEDFRPSVEALVAVAQNSQHPAVVSRAADVAWMLERRRHDMGHAAIAAYCRLLDEVAAGTRTFKHEGEEEGGRLGIGVMRRCVVIARSRSFGDQAPDMAPLTARVEAARKRALAAGAVSRHLDLAQLVWDYGLQEPAILAADIEASVADMDPAKDGHLIADALKAATQAYKRAGDTDAAHAIQRRISDTYVAMAAQMEGSAMMASSHLADAISALAGVRDARDRRRELRHQLIDVQAGISDEMGSFSQPIDLEELRAETAKRVEGLGFYDALFLFAVMRPAPDPKQAREQAVQTIRDHPLSSLFAATYHDREGKVRHTSSGAGGFGDAGDESTLEAQIAQQQTLGRNLDVGLLDVARRYISRSFYIAPDVVAPVLSASPFVPEGQENTFARGISRFLCGDATSALYTLTPLVEAGMRWVLKSHGYEVTTFDDADQTQEDKTLSALYRDQRADIEAVFGDALAFTIEQVFLHPAGPSLRHGVAHGLLHDGDPFGPDGFYACWLVLHLCLMPLYDHRFDLGLPDMVRPAKDSGDE